MSRRSAARDTYEATLALLEGWEVKPDVEVFAEGVLGLFSDTSEAGAVCLSTVHRAKGLEADRVYILRPDKLPLRWRGQTPEQAQQERNLRYVALTRAKCTLTFVTPEEEE